MLLRVCPQEYPLFLLKESPDGKMPRPSVREGRGDRVFGVVAILPRTKL